MGVLAMLERTGHAPWARHWPLLIFGLAGFVACNIDPEGWQTGKVGFWQQLLGLEVVQHRIMLAFTALFGVAEWRARSGRHPVSPWRYVFPVVCLMSGALLSHAHEVGNGTSAFLMELSHLALGLVMLVAGWSRWLELRLATTGDSHPGRLWGPALAVFGLLLIFYREESTGSHARRDVQPGRTVGWCPVSRGFVILHHPKRLASLMAQDESASR